MGSINAAIRVTDGMSPALKSMNKALNIVLNSFEKMQRISGSAIDVSDIRDARAELSNAAIAVNKLENELNQAGNAQERLTNEARQTDSVLGGLVKKAMGVASAYGVARAVMGAVSLSDQLSQNTSRSSLVTDDVDDFDKKIQASATRSRASYLDTASAVTQLAQRAGDAFGNNTDQVIAFTETLNKMYVISGASAQEQASSMLQLTQALGSGVLRGEEFNAVFEAAPNIIQSVADYIQKNEEVTQHMAKVAGVSYEEMSTNASKYLRDLASEGAISAEIVKNSIFSAAEGVNEEFEGMKWTWQQVWISFQNQAIQSLEPLLTKISDLANDPDIQNFAIGAANALGMVANAGVLVIDTVAGIGSFISDNWSLVAPVVYGAAAAMGLYTAALIASKAPLVAHNAVQAVSNGLKAVAAFRETVLAAKTSMATGATFAATAAQHGFNAALLASPLTWVLLILIAVIAAIYLIVAAINKVTGSTTSATGIIVGALTTAAAFIGNLLLGIGEVALGLYNYMYNIFIDLGNFLGNVLNDPIGSVIHLFGDMADSVLGILESIARAMDKLFGTDMAGAVSNWRGSLDGLIEITAEKYGNGAYEKIAEESNLTLEDFGIKRWEYGKAWEYGYSKGEELGNKVSDALGSLSLIKKGEEATNLANEESYKELLGDTGNTADNTKSIADGLEIAEEDLKYLTDVAEQEAINRFTTAEIKIDMQNNNSIASGMDIDGIVAQLEDKLYESMTVAAEGVYDDV